MKLTDKFLRDKGWTDNDNIIGCHPWGNRKDPRAMQASCELCEAPISAFPVTIARAKRDHTFHIICVTCMEQIKQHNEVMRTGVVRDNRFIDFD